MTYEEFVERYWLPKGGSPTPWQEFWIRAVVDAEPEFVRRLGHGAGKTHVRDALMRYIMDESLDAANDRATYDSVISAEDVTIMSWGPVTDPLSQQALAPRAGSTAAASNRGVAEFDSQGGRS